MQKNLINLNLYSTSGTTSAIQAGSYTVTFSLNDNTLGLICSLGFNQNNRKLWNLSIQGINNNGV